jgi:putative ABC transport system ATP-binding protein
MIDLQHVTMTFNEGRSNAATVLRDIDLHVEPGETIVLEGVSGSGKSTLLSIIASLLKPTSGRVEIKGELVNKLPDLHASRFRNDHIGFIFQSFNLFERLSVHDNVVLPLLVTERSQKEADADARKAMELANIIHKQEQSVEDLSGGEKQRCAIARALVNDPEIILCDEPTANLDRDNSLLFLESVQNMKAMGKTILIATHDPIFNSLECVDRIIRIDNGMIPSS